MACCWCCVRIEDAQLLVGMYACRLRVRRRCMTRTTSPLHCTALHCFGNARGVHHPTPLHLTLVCLSNHSRQGSSCVPISSRSTLMISLCGHVHSESFVTLPAHLYICVCIPPPPVPPPRAPARYAKEWEKTVKRLGRWIDFENDYKTLDPQFMESVWWVWGAQGGGAQGEVGGWAQSAAEQSRQGHASGRTGCCERLCMMSVCALSSCVVSVSTPCCRVGG
jgi:hypothetical protein